MTVNTPLPLTVSERDPGTSERSWLASSRLRAAPSITVRDLAVADAPRRILVLAPHPDDEVLAIGGLLATMARQGWAIDLIAVTDGEGSHPRSRTVTPERLALLRAEERVRALARLGLVEGGSGSEHDVRVTRLHLPDSGVSRHSDLPARIADHLRHVRGVGACLAPWSRDGHPDHDAVGRAAEEACAAAGVRLFQYPVWAWHWADAESDELPWARARTFVLDEATRAMKRRAIAAYRSQVEPLGPGAGDEAILPPAVLARFQRPFEVIFV